ncbi:valine--tRNA ligase, chloroplastic/mitochondrial 2 isoform X1 [Tanacetum coccineum]|uniref:Valine--tRNA ligase, chloroplastic/mitochondrial 2 isoform X1 n=1 Tax=Tanacetum coccineum TaxID=301880 RepID=A0ABQ5I7H0_9ASTR
MSVCCGAECFVAIGCLRWLYKRCTYVGSDDSATWPPATSHEVEPIPHLCRIILAVYETDLKNPKNPPLGGYRLNPDYVIKRVTYQQTQGHAPPYLIYLDHSRQEIVLAVRGLNLRKESDYKLLLNNRLGMQMFDGGYVHHGLLKSAVWLLEQESEELKRLWLNNGSCYKIVFVGHSLGSGVAALMTVIVVNHRDMIGGISRDLVRCYALAPARCMSLNLAVKYADVIHSVVLQDDFLPRTATPLEDIFKSIFCLPCLIFLVCLRDTFVPEGRKLRDPRRLYAPGRIYHIVERKFCRCGRYPPEVRTAIPVDGRFEHIVLSSHATADHAIMWIHAEAEKALNVSDIATYLFWFVKVTKFGKSVDSRAEHMDRSTERISLLKEKESETVTTAPKVQKFSRLKSIEDEHKDALERAVSLNIPHAVSTTEDDDYEPQESTSDNEDETFAHKLALEHKNTGLKPGRTKWNDLVEKLYERTESGKLKTRKDATMAESHDKDVSAS